ncbi:MAG TPA: calcium/sodium antiporter [Marinagarivorans sp.]
MSVAIIGIIVGLVFLVWSAGRFVEGAAIAARHFGMSPLLIGMLVVGFGTSAPEMLVSVVAAFQGNPGIALGNAYGSNITNIALILGVTALISPIAVNSAILRKELPILAVVTALSVALLWDGLISRLDAGLLLLVFGVIIIWSIRQSTQSPDTLEQDVVQHVDGSAMSLRQATFWLVTGLLLLIVSSRVLVWGAVEVAQHFGVSDIIIGLTVVAVGTSLPELASSVAAARKGEHDIAVGNIIGSNLFNTLAVVGLAGIIEPLAVSGDVLSRDLLVMSVLTVSLFVLCYGFKGMPARITRPEGVVLLAAYFSYSGYLLFTVLG